MSAIGYSNTLPSAYQPVSNPYVSSPSYGGDPGTYGVPYQSPAVGQQNFMMSIYMSMMQSQTQLQAGFSQYLGMMPQPQQPAYPTNNPAAGCTCHIPTQTPPTYGGGGGYTPAPTPVIQPAPAPAPAPPAKKGGYA